MIKLKAKLCDGDLKQIVKSSKEVDSIWTFKDVQNKYSEYIKQRTHIGNLFNVNMSIWFFGSLGALKVLADSNSNNLTMVGWLMASILLEFCILNFFNHYGKKVLKKFIEGNEHIVIDIKDVLKNMFYEECKKEKSVEPVEDKLLQYVIGKLHKKDLSYEDFLRINLDKELKGIKDSYLELKNKKDELCLLKGVYD